MRKILNLIALAALLFAPWVANAQGTDCTTAVSVTASSPFYEGFESGSMPACWTQSGSGSATWSVATGDYTSSTGAHSGTYNAKINISSYSGDQTLITPLLDLSSLSLAQISFWHIQRAWGSDVDELTVKYRASESDAWTTLQTYTSAYGSWTEETIILPNLSATYQIAFEMNSNWGYGVGLDDITIGAPPSCFRVEGLVASDILYDGATLSWTDTLNSGASYTVYYWKNGGDTSTASDTATTVTLTGLDAATAYNWYVVANCSATDNSLPSIVSSFRTDCIGGSCNITVSTTSAYASYGASWLPSAIVYQGGAALATVQGTQQVQVCSGDSVIVLYLEPEYSYESGATVTDGGGTVVFSGSTENYYDDDTLAVMANPCPSCIAPSGLAASDITTSGATLSWVDGNASGAASYTVYYWTAGIDTSSASASDTSVTLTGLTAATVYNWYVVTSCSSTDESNPSAVSTFRTDCVGGSCSLTLNMTDSYGDGWNGNAIEVHQAGGLIGSYTVPNNGSSNTAVVDVCAGNPVQLIFVLGLYPDEMGGTVADGADLTVFTISGMDSYSDGDTLAVIATPCPTCIPPANLTVGNVTDEEVTLSWTPRGGATDFAVYIGDSLVSSGINDNSYTFTDLDANTVYNFGVQAVCSSTDSSAIVHRSQRTACGAITLPYSVDFEDAEFNGAWYPCWDSIIHAGTDPSVNNMRNHTAGGQYAMYMQATSSENYNLVVSPMIPADGNNIYVRFWAYLNTGWIKAGVMTNPHDTTTFIPMAVISGDGWNEYEFMTDTLEADSSYYVAWMAYASSTSYWGTQIGEIDDIYISEIPECQHVTDLAVDTITNEGATIYWTAPEGQTNFIVRINGVDTYVTDTFYTFTGLAATTTYTASVASDCGGSPSEWISVNFTTDCASGSCDIVIAAQDSYGDGWNGGRLNFTQNGVTVGSYSMPSQGVSNTRIYDTATVSVCSGVPVTFSWQSGSYDSEVSYIIYDGGMAEVYNSATSGVNHSETIADACPTCLRPTGVQATLIDSNMLSFTWDYADGVYGYLISFDGAPFTMASGNTVTYYSLNANTAHTFSVMAICQIGDTSVARSVTVKTSCGTMTVPFVEGFEAETQGTVPSCWTVTRTGYSNYPGVSSSAYTGSKALTLAANYNDSTTIATSLVPLNGNQIRVSFWASVNQGNTLQAGVMTDLAYDTTFIPLLTVPYNNSTYTFYDFNTSTLPATEQYYVAFRLVTGGSNYSADLDDINILAYNGCAYPTNLTVTPDASFATLDWSCDPATMNFVVEHRTTDSAWVVDANALADSSYIVNGLTPATAYEVRVGLVCGSDTLWTTSVSFTTNCAPLPVPYFEDFDSYADDVMPPCWGWSSVSSTHYDGGVFLRSYHGGGSEYVVVPQLDAVLSKLKVEFDCKVGTIAENDGILLGVADASGNWLAWLDTLQDGNYSRNNHVHTIVYFPQYLNRIPAGADRVVFAQLRNWEEWALIDNISIEVLPDCYPINNLTGHNLDDPENPTFTWHPTGSEGQWQVYVDTVTVGIDSLASMPSSAFTTVYDTTYTIPTGTIQGGGIYNFFVRADCGNGQSGWVKCEFGAGSIIMNNSTTADTVTGCGFVVYDNGGPIPGYLPNSNSALVLRSENAGSQLQIFGGKFGWGSSPATLTVYDGEGTTGTTLFTYNTTDGRDTMLNTVLATSTTGSLTITFSVSGNMCHTGYELYVRCTGAAVCARPTELQGEMTSATTANVTWNGTAPNYNFYYRIHNDANWNRQTVPAANVTLTGLTPDTTYDMYVVALCTASDSSIGSVIRTLDTHYDTMPQTPCNTPSALAVNNISLTTAVLSWTAGGTETAWRIEVNGTIQYVTTNPYTLTGLTPATQYTVTVSAVCDSDHESAWSTPLVFTTNQEQPDSTYYTITAVPNNASMGNVTGGGTFLENTVITLTASSKPGYHFVEWNDNVTDSVRNHTVVADRDFVAIFARNVGIDDVTGEHVALFPNPASSTVTLTGIEAGATVMMVDMNGRVCGEWHAENSKLSIDLTSMAKGAYFVRITGEKTNAIRKLIVK